MESIICISDTSLDGNNSPSNIIYRYDKEESQIEQENLSLMEKTKKNIVVDEDESVSAITLSTFSNRVPVSWKSSKRKKKLLNVKMNLQTPNTKVNKWLSNAPFSETHLNSMKVLIDLQVPSQQHLSMIERVDCEKLDNNSSINSSRERDLINSYLKSSSSKSGRISIDSKSSTDSKLSKEKSIITIHSPSPESQENVQEKNELYSYLKLMNMNNSESKNGNVYTNRRSTRVKNLERLSKQRKLEEKLNNEGIEKDPSVDLSKMSFRELNLALDDLCSDNMEDMLSKSERSGLRSRSKCKSISPERILSARTPTSMYDYPNKSIFNGNFNAKHVPSDILLEEMDFEEALQDFVKDNGEKTSIQLFHEDLNKRLSNLDKADSSESIDKKHNSITRSQKQIKVVQKEKIIPIKKSVKKVSKKESIDGQQKKDNVPAKKMHAKKEKTSGVKRKGQELIKQTKFRKLKMHMKSLQLLPKRFKKNRPKTSRDLQDLKNSVPSDFLKATILSTPSNIRRTRGSLMKTKKKFKSKLRNEKEPRIFIKKKKRNLEIPNKVENDSDPPVLIPDSNTSESIIASLNDNPKKRSPRAIANARSRALLLKSIFSASKRRPKSRKKRNYAGKTENDDIVTKIIQSSSENDKSQTYISAGSKVLTENMDLDYPVTISTQSTTKIDNIVKNNSKSKFLERIREPEQSIPKVTAKIALPLANGQKHDVKVVTSTKTIKKIKEMAAKSEICLHKIDKNAAHTSDETIEFVTHDKTVLISKRSLRKSKTWESPIISNTSKPSTPINDKSLNSKTVDKHVNKSVKPKPTVIALGKENPKVTKPAPSQAPSITNKEIKITRPTNTIILLQNEIISRGVTDNDKSLVQNDHSYTLGSSINNGMDASKSTLKNLAPEHRQSLLKSPAVLQNKIKLSTTSVNDKHQIDQNSENLLANKSNEAVVEIVKRKPIEIFYKGNKVVIRKNKNLADSVCFTRVHDESNTKVCKLNTAKINSNSACDVEPPIKQAPNVNKEGILNISEYDFDTYASKIQDNFLLNIPNYESSTTSTFEDETSAKIDQIQKQSTDSATIAEPLSNKLRSSKKIHLTRKLKKPDLKTCIELVKESLPKIDVMEIAKLQGKLTKAASDLAGLPDTTKIGTEKIHVRTDLTDPTFFDNEKYTADSNEKIIDVDAEKNDISDVGMPSKNIVKLVNVISPTYEKTKKQGDKNSNLISVTLLGKQNQKIIVNVTPTKKQNLKINDVVETNSSTKQTEDIQIDGTSAKDTQNAKSNVPDVSKSKKQLQKHVIDNNVDSMTTKKDLNALAKKSGSSSTTKQTEKTIASIKKVNGSVAQTVASKSTNSTESRSLHNVLTMSPPKSANTDKNADCTDSWDQAKSADSQAIGKPKRWSHPVEIRNEDGPVLYSFYLDYNLVVAQELRISFWTQSPLGNVLGAQDMWIPKGSIPRLSLDQGCVHKKSNESVIFKDNSFAYIELWTKEHKSDYRQSPVADVFAVVYFWKHKVGVDKKVLQLENIHSFAEDVRFVVLKNSLKILVSWRVTNDNVTKSIIRCYQLSPDYKSVLDSSDLQSVEHEISSLHNVGDNDTIVLGSGENKLTIWNLDYGYISATIDISSDNLSSPITTWVKSDRGFLFTLQKYEDEILRLVAVNGLSQSSKRLLVFKPPGGYERLEGVCMGNGVLIAFYSNGIVCWNLQNGDLILEEQTQDTKFLPSDEHVIIFSQDRVSVKHGLSYLITDYDFTDI